MILGNNHYLRKLIEITCRVSRNELIKTDSKYKNEQTIEAIKEHVGVAEYYRLQASVEQERKLWKAQQKSQLAELAITDQQAYAEIKAGKKRKF